MCIQVRSLYVQPSKFPISQALGLERDMVFLRPSNPYSAITMILSPILTEYFPHLKIHYETKEIYCTTNQISYFSTLEPGIFH